MFPPSICQELNFSDGFFKLTCQNILELLQTYLEDTYEPHLISLSNGPSILGNVLGPESIFLKSAR